MYPTTEQPNLNISFFPSLIDAQSLTNIITNPVNYRNTSTTTLATPERIYIRIDNSSTTECTAFGDNLYIDLIVEPIPYFEIEDQILCDNILPTPLEVRVENYDSLYAYEWKDANGNTLLTDADFSGIAFITSGGEHTVTATSTNGCTKTHTFNVQISSIPVFNTVTILDDRANNSISVLVNGYGDYEFALDNQNFVDGNEINGHVFYNVIEGLHTIYVNDKNGCAPIIEKEVIVIRFPKYISPNHDGQHDEFYVYGADDFVVSSVTIFDRYGKVITILNQNEKWDGTHLGKLVLPADYWFLAKFIDSQGKIYERKGHFSVKL